MNKAKLSIGLINPKSPTNVGAIMRAAGCFSADSVYYTGQRYQRAAKFNTDTKNVASTIPLTHVEQIHQAASAGMSIICVDLIEGAIPLPNFTHPKNALYVFGPEDGTISQDIIDRADSVVYVPTIGCLNLAASVNVLFYDRLCKGEQSFFSDELIRQSRDTNNKVKVTD